LLRLVMAGWQIETLFGNTKMHCRFSCTKPQCRAKFKRTKHKDDAWCRPE
jgi:hypothetical protein